MDAEDIINCLLLAAAYALGGWACRHWYDPLIFFAGAVVGRLLVKWERRP